MIGLALAIGLGLVGLIFGSPIGVFGTGAGSDHHPGHFTGSGIVFSPPRR